jgi:hypothetical protein
MEQSNEKYLQFPLYLMREMLIDKEGTINRIINYGIYRYSKKFKYDLKKACIQVMYYYYRRQYALTKYLEDKITEYAMQGKIELDYDYNGFTGGGEVNFDPEIELEGIAKIINTDIDFRNSIIEFYQIHLAYQSLGISGNIQNCLKIGKQIEDKIPENEPMPMISKSLSFEFRDKDKSEFEIIQLCAFIAAKSILGVKSSVKTNKMHIVCRMFGYSSIKQLPPTLPKSINKLFLKYSNRYHIDKVLQQLELNWNLITYSNNIRGMYIAMSNKTSIEQLALIAETKKQKNRIAELKKQKEDAKAKALQQLNKQQQLK